MNSPDIGLDTLLDLDGSILEQEGGYWIKIEARRAACVSSRLYQEADFLCVDSVGRSQLRGAAENWKSRPEAVGSEDLRQDNTLLPQHLRQGAI